MKNQTHPLTLRYLGKNLCIVLGLVLIWRGVWHLLDWVDTLFFSGHHWVSAGLGIVIGLAVLYFPDHDLKEIQKL